MSSTEKVVKIDYTGKHLFIGIDMHKKNWVITVRTYDLELRTLSIDPFPEVLEKFLEGEYPGGSYHLVYEAGCFGYASYDYFKDRGIEIIVTPPNRMYRENGPIKTDKRDSRALALVLSRGMLRQVVVPSRQVRELRQMLRIRHKQRNRKKQIQQEILGMLRHLNIRLQRRNWGRGRLEELRQIRFCEEGLNYSFSLLLDEYEFYVKQLALSNAHIKEYSRQIAAHWPTIERISQIKGIGPLTAFQFTMHLFDRKDRFRHPDKLVHYLGLTPSEHSTGGKERKGRISGGNPQLRALIIQVAWQAVRWDPILLDKFERVYEHSGNRQKAIVAVARKLMVRVYTIYQRNERYQIGLAA
jgi:transposase